MMRIAGDDFSSASALEASVRRVVSTVSELGAEVCSSTANGRFCQMQTVMLQPMNDQHCVHTYRCLQPQECPLSKHWRPKAASPFSANLYRSRFLVRRVLAGW